MYIPHQESDFVFLRFVGGSADQEIVTSYLLAVTRARREEGGGGWLIPHHLQTLQSAFKRKMGVPGAFLSAELPLPIFHFALGSRCW